MYIAGIDVGTTGSKVVVFDENGKTVGTYYTEYDASHIAGTHEIDFNCVRDGVISILGKACGEYRISAVGVTSFGETYAMLDENDNVLLPSMLYTDPRGEEECSLLCEKIGTDRMIGITGVMPNTMYSISKIMWQKNHFPEKYAKCRRILLGEDFIVYTLCGKAKIDHSLAARTSAFDIKNRIWSKEIFTEAGVDVSLMSEPVETGAFAGKVSARAKEKLGISYDFDVFCGAHDQIAAIIGSGVFEKGSAMDGTGTVECIPVLLDDIPNSRELYSCGYSVVPFPGGKYAVYALSFTGGASLKWFRDNFAELEKELCKKEGKNVYACLDSKISDKPTGLLLVPHFAGAATPYMDSSAKAAVIGLTLETTKFDLYKALMEGTSYEIKLNFEKLTEYTGSVREIRATGGGASSDAWLQIKADILGTKILAMTCPETGAAGTAALVGCGMGLFHDLPTAIQKLNGIRKEFVPNENNAKEYAALSAQYKKIYPKLCEIRTEEKA